MAIVNFSIPKILEEKISNIIEAKGFASKAEFFRFLLMNYFEKQNNRAAPDPQIEELSDKIEELTLKKIDPDKLPSAKEQFSQFNKKNNIKL